MKSRLLPLITLFLFSFPALAGDAELKSITVSWGDSAFTSGLNASFLFTLKNNKVVEFVGNHQRFYSVLDFNIKGKDKLLLGPSLGVFKGMPWVGPRITYYPVKPVMLMYWGSWSAGRIGKLEPNIKSACQQFSVYVMPTKSTSVGYNVVKFDTYKTTHLPEIAYFYQLKDDIKLGASATYDVVAKKPLFCLSLSFNFSKKK